jgi:hypothetical protein
MESWLRFIKTNKLSYTLTIFIFLTALLGLCSLLLGCASDVTIVDQAETRVVVDSIQRESHSNELDILVVIDTSCSMFDNYETIGIGMDTLRKDIEDSYVNYQFGFITADPSTLSYVGPFNEDSATLDVMLAPELLEFTAREEGFSSSYVFLNSSDGVSFTRSNSDFLLFIISDEDEQGSITPTVFSEWLHDEYENVEHDVVSIVRKETSLCGSELDIGHNYIDLANLYGKDTLDICDSDWSAWLASTSVLTKPPLADFVVLSHPEPLVETIIVYINHIETKWWSYSKDSNTVTIDDLTDEVTLIEVGYEVLL